MKLLNEIKHKCRKQTYIGQISLTRQAQALVEAALKNNL
jgi:hypothetical protein